MGHTSQPSRTKPAPAVPCVRPIQKQRSLSKFYSTKSRSFPCLQDAMDISADIGADALSKGAWGQRFYVACTKSRPLFTCAADDICVALLQTTLTAAVTQQNLSAATKLVPQ